MGVKAGIQRPDPAPSSRSSRRRWPYPRPVRRDWREGPMPPTFVPHLAWQARARRAKHDRRPTEPSSTAALLGRRRPVLIPQSRAPYLPGLLGSEDGAAAPAGATPVRNWRMVRGPDGFGRLTGAGWRWA